MAWDDNFFTGVRFDERNLSYYMQFHFETETPLIFSVLVIVFRISVRDFAGVSQSFCGWHDGQRRRRRRPLRQQQQQPHPRQSHGFSSRVGGPTRPGG